MFSRKELNDAIALCKSQLEELGYTVPKQIKYETSNRMTRALGKCQWQYNRLTREITNLTIKLSNDLTPQIMPNTLMHELIHALYPLDGHGYQFHRVASQVNKAFGYHITTYASGESLEVIREVRQSKLVKVECTGCGATSMVKPNTKLYHGVMTGLCTCKLCRGKDFKQV